MTKVKKYITTTFLVLVLLASSLLLMACGNKVTATDSYNLLGSLVSVYKSELGIFVQGNIKGISTNYHMPDFTTKNEVGESISGGDNYVAFVAIGMNYIDRNVEALNGLEMKYNFKSFNKSITEMNDAYNNVVKEYANMKNLDSSVNYNIYNGYFARYREYTKFFINEIYDVATELGEILIEAKGDGIGTSDLTSDTFNSYADYNVLLASQDFKNFFMDSESGKLFDQTLEKQTQTIFNEYCQSLFKKPQLALTTEKAQNMKELFDAVNVDRKNVTRSLEEFSLYDFYSLYEGSLTAYEKTNADANIYYLNIENYFGTNGLLGKLYAYLTA